MEHTDIGFRGIELAGQARGKSRGTVSGQAYLTRTAGCFGYLKASAPALQQRLSPGGDNGRGDPALDEFTFRRRFTDHTGMIGPAVGTGPPAGAGMKVEGYTQSQPGRHGPGPHASLLVLNQICQLFERPKSNGGIGRA